VGSPLSEGALLGCPVGELGLEVGCDEGKRLGCVDGCAEGWKVGCEVGAPEGRLEGSGIGALETVGIVDGCPLGWEVGLPVFGARSQIITKIQKILQLYGIPFVGI
jgi:hypothetical protein